MSNKTNFLTESDIKNIINEELGILLEIAETAKQVYNDIVQDLATREAKDNVACIIKNGYVPCTLNNITFNINYTFRNFRHKPLVDEIGVDNLTGGTSAFLNKHFIICNIDILAISGSINKQMALYTIQHELEHIFQQIRSNKRIPGDDMRYAKMRTDMETGEGMRFDASRLVYACYKSEQEGFINGTYAWCMADDFKTEPFNYIEIKNSPAGSLYSEMKSLYNKALENKELENILKNDYHLSLDDIGIMIRNFAKRIGRLLIKVNTDKSKIWRK